jgi:S-DNA-T family DNA segregation ATPase FtsK/SpoIIIE
MTSPPIFQRAPRLLPEPATGEVEIPPPSSAPSAPSVGLVSILLPAVFSIGAVVAVLLTVQGSGSLLLTVVSFGFMGLTSLTSLGTYMGQRRSYRRTMREREQQYRALLTERRQTLTTLRDRQLAAMTHTHPEPAECLARVEARDQRLWERSHEDADFLAVRLGLGEQPLAATIKLPPESGAAPDPLLLEARALAAEFARVPGIPACLALGGAGAAGVTGPRAEALAAVRALVLQLATHHGPDEVKIVALYPAYEADDWAWLRWLPHVWSDDRRQRWLASEPAAARRLLVGLYDLFNRRLQQAEAPGASPAPALPVFVLLLADPRLVEGEPILRLLLGRRPAVGAVPILLADRVADLPKGCQAIADLAPGGVRLIQTGATTATTPFTPDAVDLATGDRFARAMAPIRLRRLAAPTDIPTTVTLLDALDTEAVDDLDILGGWRANRPYESLAAPIGRQGGGKLLALDLHETGHGPHGLIAGATGSGKSELLQALIASLATRFHPHEAAFVLIDYKGGGMANAFLDLPHLVGSITNLEGNRLEGSLAMRAMIALKSEIERREALLARTGARNIDDYQRRRRLGEVAEPLPHLVVIVDEFAELKTKQPDFMRELVSAVRVGRSLGLHLILATQKPAGVIDEQIWANSRFRLCLRVLRPEDSQEVLKRPDAAALTGAGRAYFQVGFNEVFELFQAAYGGAPYQPDAATDADDVTIAEVTLDGRRRSLAAPAPTAELAVAGSQLQALVGKLRDVARSARIERLPGPWLPALPEQIALDDLRPPESREGWDGQEWREPRRWLEPVVGLFDDPAHQRQEPLRLPLGRDGHLAVYGSPGSGKTTFLQTLILSLALTYSPRDIHLYLLDFSGRLLTMFAPLPHVGAVILADEAERLRRLLRFLQHELDERKERLARAGVSTLTAYRSVAAEPLPAIVVVVDNFPSLVENDPDAEEALTQVAREGGNLGIHLVLTATGPLLIRSRISSNISLAAALALADRSDYSAAVGRTGGLEPAPVPGRGLVKADPPLEFQTALPVDGPTEAARAETLRAAIDRMATAWNGPRPRAMPVLPAVAALSDLASPPGPADDGRWRAAHWDDAADDDGQEVAWPPRPASTRKPALTVAPIGLEVDELAPLLVDLRDGPHFLIAGPAQSGKTTLLHSWLLALATQAPPTRLHLYLVDFRWAGLLPLRDLPHVRRYIDNDDWLTAALVEISETMRERRQALEEARRETGSPPDERAWLARYPTIVLAIDDAEAFSAEAQSTNKDMLEQLVRRERGLGFHVLLAGQASELAGSWEGLVKAVRQLQVGFLLGSTDHGDLQIFNLRLPPGESGLTLPPGRGYYAQRGRSRKVKVATAEAGAVTLPTWVRRLRALVESQPRASG